MQRRTNTISDEILRCIAQSLLDFVHVEHPTFAGVQANGEMDCEREDAIFFMEGCVTEQRTCSCAIRATCSTILKTVQPSVSNST